jgi:hypothetical protein
VTCYLSRRAFPASQFSLPRRRGARDWVGQNIARYGLIMSPNDGGLNFGTVVRLNLGLGRIAAIPKLVLKLKMFESPLCCPHGILQ